jgi:MFS family permease
MRVLSPLARLLAASFLMDGSLYLILTAVPLKAVSLQAGPFVLGLLPVLSSGVYIVSALFFGRLSDRVSRTRMCRLGAWIRALSAIGLTQARSVPALLAWMPVLGIASALFWPGLQAAIGEAYPERDLGRNLGAFNISWSGGKMLGFLCGGVIMASAGFAPALLLAAGATALAALFVPARIHRAGEGAPAGAPAPEADSFAPGPQARRAWKRIGWSANFVLFGIGATLNYQYPKLLFALGFNGRDFGLYLGAVYLFQTLAFVLLMRWGSWRFRLWPLLLSQTLTLGAVAGLGWLTSRPLILATAPLVGLGLGMSYTSSIYYSLFREGGAGRNTGIHESLLGTGTFLLPLLGGALAQATGGLRAPYVLCALVLAGIMVAEAGMARRVRPA